MSLPNAFVKCFLTKTSKLLNQIAPKFFMNFNINLIWANFQPFHQWFLPRTTIMLQENSTLDYFSHSLFSFMIFLCLNRRSLSFFSSHFNRRCESFFVLFHLIFAFDYCFITIFDFLLHFLITSNVSLILIAKW